MLDFPNIDPIAFWLGPLPVRWYALAYIVSIFFGLRYMVSLAANERLWRAKQKRPSYGDIQDFLLWGMLGIIIGGRLGAVLFYYPDYYFANPHKIFFIWEGGMAFHGGLIGVVLALFLYARRRGLSFRTISDLAAAPVPVGLFLGRIANFINGELWGRPADVPWAMIFPRADDLPRHPSQLYEAALEGVVLFIVLRLATHYYGTLKRPGLTSAIFFAGYALTRIVSEIFREPDIVLLQAGSAIFTMGMALSLPLLAFALLLVLTLPPKQQ